MFDSQTRADAVSEDPELDFTHLITLLNCETPPSDENTIKFIKEKIMKNYCSTSISSVFTKDDIVASYKILAKNGEDIVLITIDPKFCRMNSRQIIN
jgi:hypothetical protein